MLSKYHTCLAQVFCLTTSSEAALIITIIIITIIGPITQKRDTSQSNKLFQTQWPKSGDEMGFEFTLLGMRTTSIHGSNRLPSNIRKRHFPLLQRIERHRVSVPDDFYLSPQFFMDIHIVSFSLCPCNSAAMIMPLPLQRFSG